MRTDGYPANPPASQHPEPATVHIGFIVPPEGGTHFDYTVFRKAFDDLPQLLKNWEDIIVQKTTALLKENETERKPNLDALFAFHTDYVSYCIEAQLAQRPIRLWRERLEPAVTLSELRLRDSDLNARIHRGAPLYNVGLCSFVLGDFDRAIHFLCEAGCHDELLGRGDTVKILLGNHPLSHQVIIRPLETILDSNWISYYQIITGLWLDGGELMSLLLSMADRPVDAIQAVVALHRLLRTLGLQQNYGTCVVRFRAIADLLHLIESFLRQFQRSVSGELGAHLKTLSGKNKTFGAAREQFRKDRDAWAHQQGCHIHSTQAMNWLLRETGPRIRSTHSQAYAAGTVAFFCHQYRNSLLHENEENLTMFRNWDDCVTAACWVLAMLRVCSFAKEGKFSADIFA